ncbi:MAG: hypothetical protein ACR2JV_09150, partial [Gaiellales bacterium]
MVAVCAVGAANAAAATFAVTNADDSGDGSLRGAIGQANAASGADTVVFASGVTGTILVRSAIAITDPVTIIGPGQGQLTLRGSALTRILAIDARGAVEIRGLALVGASALGDRGGAISAAQVPGDMLTVSACRFEDNVASAGGAIATDRAVGASSGGSLTVMDSTFDDNRATVDVGGAIA